ncbi:MAG: kelch repeat-containing protein [Bacteroidota bacterium]|nr:kelch repeat-containing protein [Bacteroidota bacterium]
MKRLCILFPSVTLLTLGLTGIAFSQNTWTKASSQGFSPRFSFTSSEVNGKIYVTGGSYTFSQVSPTTQAYDPKTNTWSTLNTSGSFKIRTAATACVVNGMIYVIGGYDANLTDISEVDVFDPAKSTWSAPTVTGTFDPRDGHTSAVVGNKIYVIGGSDSLGNFPSTVDVFDPSTNTWSQPETFGKFTPRTDLSSCVIDNKIYVLGGSIDSGLNTSYSHVSILEVFDPSTNQWSSPVTTGAMTGRSAFTANAVGNKIYAIGGLGYGSYPYVDNLDVFDPSTNTWISPATVGLFTDRFSLSSSVVDGKIYALGGFNFAYSDSGSLNINEILTPESSSVVVVSKPEDIVLSPNPTHGITTAYSIPQDVSRIAILNVLGQSVLEIPSGGLSVARLNLSKLVPGLYYARFFSGRSVVEKKILIE